MSIQYKHFDYKKREVLRGEGNMKYNPYFLFDGKAEEAIHLYGDAFNGETQVLKFKDAPPNPNFQTPEEIKELVMHGEVRMNDMVFMICDATPMQPVTVGNKFLCSMLCNV